MKENQTLRAQLADLQAKHDKLEAEFRALLDAHSATEQPANAVFKAVDRLRVLIYFLAGEGSGRRLTEREFDMLESGADELAERAAELILPWRNGQLEPIVLP